MISLERIVRPYQRPTGLNTGRLISRSVAPSTDVAFIAWGDVGNLPTPTQEDNPDDSVGFNLKVCENDYNETQRTVQPTRVENPDDPSQFVIVNRVQSMSFKVEERNKLAGSIRTESTTFTGMNLGYIFDVPDDNNCNSKFNMADATHI